MLINVGYGNLVNSNKIVAIISSNSAPAKRLIQGAREGGTMIDVTQGRKTKSIVITETHVLLSALLPETISSRFPADAKEKIMLPGGEENE